MKTKIDRLVTLVYAHPGLDAIALKGKGWNPRSHGPLRDAEKAGRLEYRNGGWFAVTANLQEKNKGAIGVWIVVTTTGNVLETFSYDGDGQRAVTKEKAFLAMRTFNCAVMGKVVG